MLKRILSGLKRKREKTNCLEIKTNLTGNTLAGEGLGTLYADKCWSLLGSL